MIAFLATTAFFQAVSADSNLTWLQHFDADPEGLDTNLPGLKPLGEEYTCFDLTENGVAYNLAYNKFCPTVSDYKMQCAGKDMEPLGKKGASKEEAKKVAERRLAPAEKVAEKVAEEADEAKIALANALANALAKKEAQLEENVKQYGALASCIDRNRKYTWSWYNTSWLKEGYSTLTCKEVLDKWAGGDCKSEYAKQYAFVTCCPATCNTKAELGCPADGNVDDVPAVKTDDSTDANTDDSAITGTTSGASTMGLISALLVLAQ